MLKFKFDLSEILSIAQIAQIGDLSCNFDSSTSRTPTQHLSSYLSRNVIMNVHVCQYILW